MIMIIMMMMGLGLVLAAASHRGLLFHIDWVANQPVFSKYNPKHQENTWFKSTCTVVQRQPVRWELKFVNVCPRVCVYKRGSKTQNWFLKLPWIPAMLRPQTQQHQRSGATSMCCFLLDVQAAASLYPGLKIFKVQQDETPDRNIPTPTAECWKENIYICGLRYEPSWTIGLHGDFNRPK